MNYLKIHNAIIEKAKNRELIGNIKIKTMKDFIEYKKALALKELGFDAPCLSYFADGEAQSILGIHYNSDDANRPFESVARPTFSQVFRFFREKYDISSFVKRDFRDRKLIGYYFGIEGTKEDFYSKTYPTFEEAELECLKKLISVVS